MNSLAKTLDAAYRYMFKDQCEGATQEYLAQFQMSYDPDDINWSDENEACMSFCSLIDELEASRTDMDTLYSDAGVTPDILSVLGFL